jgi:hypothetical protein
MVATKILGFFQQHPIHASGTSAPAFAFGNFRNICRRSSAQARPSGGAPKGLGIHVWALVQLHPPKPTPRPAGGSHCLAGHHLGRGGGWQVAGTTGHRKGQLRVLGTRQPPPSSAPRTKKPRTGGPRGHRGGGGPADPICFCGSP